MLVLQTQTKSAMDKITVPTNAMDVLKDLVWLKSGEGRNSPLLLPGYATVYWFVLLLPDVLFTGRKLILFRMVN